MSVPSQMPYYQRLVPGGLMDVIKKVRDWQECQAAGFEILPFEEEGSEKEISFCLNNPLWGEFGLIHLAYVDHGQTLQSLYRSPYPTLPETSALEPQVRASVPQPAAALRLNDMYGPEKTLPYLAARLHEQRSLLLESVRISLAHHLGGASVAPIPMDEPGPQMLISPTTEDQSDPHNIPTNRKHPKRDINSLKGADTEMLQLWSAGLSVKQIATQMGRTEKTIYNRITMLRKAHGEKVVPRRR